MNENDGKTPESNSQLFPQPFLRSQKFDPVLILERSLNQTNGANMAKRLVEPTWRY